MIERARDRICSPRKIRRLGWEQARQHPPVVWRELWGARTDHSTRTPRAFSRAVACVSAARPPGNARKMSNWFRGSIPRLG